VNPSQSTKVIGTREPQAAFKRPVCRHNHGAISMNEMNAEHYGDTHHTSEVMRRFNRAFQCHDPDALTEMVAEDCIIESTRPAPNGSRHVGRRACLAVWQGLAGESGTHFQPEEVFASGDRAIIRWRYFWGAGQNNSVRGVNLMRVRGGQIIEAMGYVKSS
jgi:ketosteroid isomerase-like protein